MDPFEVYERTAPAWNLVNAGIMRDMEFRQEARQAKRLLQLLQAGYEPRETLDALQKLAAYVLSGRLQSRPCQSWRKRIRAAARELRAIELTGVDRG